MKKLVLLIGSITLLGLIAIAAGCGGPGGGGTDKAIASGPAGNNLTATISSPGGVLKQGEQQFTLAFADASGKPVDVGSAAFNLHMAAMGSMAAMNNSATLTTTGTPGVYRGKVEIEMVGDWQAQITYEGPAGKGSFALPITAK